MTARDDYPATARNAWHSSGYPRRREAALMLDELDQLRRWKAEATEVIQGWERVWEACGGPGPLGGIKSDNVLRVLREDGVL